MHFVYGMRQELSKRRSLTNATGAQNGNEKITGLLCEKLGIAATDVFIVMNDPPLENWGMGGNQK